MIPSNIVAYVSPDDRWGFVLERHLHKFQKDVSNYGTACIPVPDFNHKLLQCTHTDQLSCEFSDILWLDDDFIEDETISFDFDGFALIDEGVPYLNPKHFSVVQLIKMMENTGKSHMEPNF